MNMPIVPITFKKRVKSSILVFGLLLFGLNILPAQFYNGHQMSFGKNRVQYKKDSHWKYLRYEKFDVYFYGKSDYQAKRIAKLAEEKIPEIEHFFGFSLRKRPIFVSYRTLADFRAGNIGYKPDDESTNTGGVTRINDNKVLVYFEGENAELEQLISGGISQIIVNEMLFGGSFRQKLSSSTLINLPEWYIEGLISYLHRPWSYEIENAVKDMFLSGKMKKINHLHGEEARIAGHSFWYFISVRYGKAVIPNIIYLTRANKNSDTGFKAITGKSVKELSPDWTFFYERNLDLEDLPGDLPEKNDELLKTKKNEKIQNLKISPDGRYLAYVTNRQGRYKVKLYDKEKDKNQNIYQHGHRLEQITDYSYPVSAWHPSGSLFSFIIEVEGRPVLYMYYPESKEMKMRNLTYLHKVLSFDYSDSGFDIAMSGVRDGKTDIYIFNFPSGVFTSVTDDAADDLYPEYVNGSKDILFSSNRLSADTENTESYMKTYDLFLYHIPEDDKQNGSFTRVSNTPYTNESSAREISKNKFICLTDTNGIINQAVAEFDSTIAYIDTITHYRYFSKQKRITDFAANIYRYDISDKPKNSYDVFLYNRKYRVFENPLQLNRNYSDKKNITDFKRRYIRNIKTEIQKHKAYQAQKRREQERLDSIRSNPPEKLPHPDSMIIDINNYTFEKERKNSVYYQINPIPADSTNQTEQQADTLIRIRNYYRTFYTSYATQRIDFGFLSHSYQNFTGSAFYFNPGMNVFMNVGIYELFEDYRLTAGFRLGLNLDSYEYLFTFQDFKKRWDKEYIYRRLTYTQAIDDQIDYSPEMKMYTNQVMGIFKYPFSQVAAAKFTTSLRHDKVVLLPFNQATLEYPDQYQFFSGLKAEYIFDNSLSLGLNLHEGLRFKIFSEFLQEVDQGYTNLWVNGFDFRFYKRIHRNFIFASRFAGSAVFGKSKLLYYLGGVDNWYVISPDNNMFDRSVNINTNENYVYQAVATNMRGFIQNARNGTNFAVMNNELRLPLFRYLANRPLSSEMLNNFQIVGFFDLGSAWSGISPYDESNAYKTETVSRNSVKVIIEKNRSAVVAGYGFGFRSKLFGYFFRLDWAWGIDDQYIMPRVFYFSLSTDF